MYSIFNSKKEISTEFKILRTLFPSMKIEEINGHIVCVDNSVDSNLEAVYQDILDNNVTEQTKNSILYCLQKLEEVRNILNNRRIYPKKFEYYVVGAKPLDLSQNIQVKKENILNEEYGDF